MPRHFNSSTLFNAKKNEASKQYQLWRSMRVMRRFTRYELLATVPDSTLSTVTGYMTRLLHAGLLVGEERASRRTKKVYRLVVNTGPYAPTLRADGRVFDPNTNIIHGESKR